MLFHESVQALSQRFLAQERRHVYITPTSYLELIHSYKTLLSKKQNEVPHLFPSAPSASCMPATICEATHHYHTAAAASSMHNQWQTYACTSHLAAALRTYRTDSQLALLPINTTQQQLTGQ